MLIQEIHAALRAWDRQVRRVVPLVGGWNSATWLVKTDEGRYVAKLGDHVDEDPFTAGLAVARWAAARGFAAGAPLPTRTGELFLRLPEGPLALLEYVPGSPPDLSSPAQARRAGRTLARAHTILRECPIDVGPRHRWPWGWVSHCLDRIPMDDRVRTAAEQVWHRVVAAVRTGRLTVQLIHADAAPDAFRLAGTTPELDGIIDWSTVVRGPVLYDLASFAVVTRSTHPAAASWCVEGYLRELPELATELDHLPLLEKARWMANAIYFSSRIDKGVTRGSSSATANEDGLAEAYAGMVS